MNIGVQSKTAEVFSESAIFIHAAFAERPVAKTSGTLCGEFWYVLLDFLQTQRKPPKLNNYL